MALTQQLSFDTAACAEVRRMEEMPSINGRTLDPMIPGKGYSFFLAGHIYGTPANKYSIIPAVSFLENIDSMNESGASFLVLLGDVYFLAMPPHMRTFSRTIAQLGMPVFNALGNHDVSRSQRAAYMERFGRTYGVKRNGGEFFIFLDTEITDGEITGEQLDFLRMAMEFARSNEDINHVFIFSHKLIWAPAFEWA